MPQYWHDLYLKKQQPKTPGPTNSTAPGELCSHRSRYADACRWKCTSDHTYQGYSDLRRLISTILHHGGENSCHNSNATRIWLIQSSWLLITHPDKLISWALSQPGHTSRPTGVEPSLPQGGDSSFRIHSVHPSRDLSGDPQFVVAAFSGKSTYVSLCRSVVS